MVKLFILFRPIGRGTFLLLKRKAPQKKAARSAHSPCASPLFPFGQSVAMLGCAETGFENPGLCRSPQYIPVNNAEYRGTLRLG